MRLTLLALAFAVGCSDGGGSNTTDSGDENDGCPDGLQEARTAAVLVTGYLQNGVGLGLTFDSTATLSSGQPAACVSSDRLLGQWVLVSAGEPAVVFRQSLTSFGAQAIDGSAGAATLEIIGQDQVLATEWQTGTWFVDADGTTGPVTSQINANAVTQGGGTYSINAGFEATP